MILQERGDIVHTEINLSDTCSTATRERIYRAISDNQGISFGGIMKKAEVGNGTASYHLDRLERHGMIVSRVCGSRRLFWTSDFSGLRSFRHLSPMCHEIMKVLYSVGREVSVGEIAAALGASHQKVSYNLRTLEMRGAVQRRRRGRETLCVLVGNTMVKERNLQKNAPIDLNNPQNHLQWG